MTLQERLNAVLAAAVENKECAGVNLLVRKDGEDLVYAQAGMADLAAGTPIRRDNIFRLYSQSKPVTAAAVMILVERGLIDLMDGVDKFLPGFGNPRVVGKDWTELLPAGRAPWIMELLGMSAGLCYPDSDSAGRYAARIIEDAQQAILAGGGIPTVELANRLGEQPLAFYPGTHWRYSTCADVLGAVVEVVSGKRFGDFLRDELFTPLEMPDTGFWVPEEKRDRFVTAYKRENGALTPWTSLHLAVGEYSREPAFQSGGAGLVSTLEDYSHFAQMMLNGGEWQGKRILSPASVRFLTTPQLSGAARQELWDNLSGYAYGKLVRVCTEPEKVIGLALPDEYGWDGWLGTCYCNFPNENMTILSMQNTTDCGMSAVVRKARNVVLAEMSK